ncbi:MAG: DUF2971 domain-containing protein [Mycolicibacterium rufum]|nr:DUF2971 domain-containing protein [Mycolicibacterium rufum]
MHSADPATNDDWPSVLYHYTDAAGLMGILKPAWPQEIQAPVAGGAALLRASDLRYMNDARELSFGAEVMCERLRENAASKHDEMGEAFEQIADRLSQDLFAPDARHLRAFAACFCAEGDLLSQWRGYAGGVGGFAIGFPIDVLRFRAIGVAARPPLVPLTSWSPIQDVLYGEARATAEIDAFLATLRKGWGLEPNRRWVVLDTDGKPHIEWLMVSVYRLVARLKHAAFEEEREYRLIYVGGEGHLVSMRAAQSGLIPYVSFAMNLPDKDRNPVPEATVADIVVGPGKDQRGQVAAVRDLLQAAGYPPTDVRASEAPYRG